eukprot:3702109-Rhodomonas_salina.1
MPGISTAQNNGRTQQKPRAASTWRSPDRELVCNDLKSDDPLCALPLGLSFEDERALVATEHELGEI